MNVTDYDINSMYAWEPHKVTIPKAYELNTSFEHEGTTWYQIIVRDGRIGGWIEKHDEDLWWENAPEWKKAGKTFLYTVHEKLYTYICLKWGNTGA